MLGILRRQMVMLTGFATGVLLICDAWFDWMTSNPADVGWATVTALFVELPLAALLIIESCRLLRVVPAPWGVLTDRCMPGMFRYRRPPAANSLEAVDSPGVVPGDQHRDTLSIFIRQLI